MSEEIEPHLKIKVVFIFTAILVVLMPVASASSVGAYNVQVTNKYVKATAMCSCGQNDYYCYMTGCFKNYCPTCHSYGTLAFNPKGTAEGEWTCTQCGCDFCAADGKEKMPGSDIYLVPYKVPTTSASTVPEAHAQKVTEDDGVVNLLNKIKYYSNKSFLS